MPMIAANKITAGSWSARWHRHVIHLRQRGEYWDVTLWDWPTDAKAEKRFAVAVAQNYRTAHDAIAWACDQLTDLGAGVMLDGKLRDLAQFLAFTPAPEVVT